MSSKIKAVLTKSGILIKYSEFKKFYSDEYLIAIKAIMNKFEIRYNTFKSYFIILKGYKTKRLNGKKYIQIPRFGFFQLFNKPIKIKGVKLDINSFNINNQIIEPPKIKKVSWVGGFRGNQQICFDEIMKNYYNKEKVIRGDSGLTLNLEAGQGKTFVSMGLIDKLKTKTMIVTHTKTVLYQWVDELKRYFPKAKIGIYHGGEKTDGDIVVSIINSLVLEKIKFKEKGKIIEIPPLEYFSRFGFLIVDESHKYCSKNRGCLFWKFQCSYMLGLSATPNERNDGFDPYMHWQLGSVLEARNIENYSEADIPFKGRIKMIKYLGHNSFTETVINEEYETINTAATLNRMITDPYRLHIIANELKELISLNHNTFIFSDRKNYLDEIKGYLNHLNIQNEIVVSREDEEKVMKLVGGSSAEQVQNARDKATVILTTYQYAGTGCSIPKMNAIILATPRKSGSRQTINRIFRLGSNYDIERKIIDIVDWMTIYKGQWYKRKKYYIEKKYPIEEEKLKWENINLIDIFKETDQKFKKLHL